VDSASTSQARLASGRWPEPGDDGTLQLSAEEFEVLIGSAKLTQKLRRQEVTGGKLF
jgi:hypothetical protein